MIISWHVKPEFFRFSSEKKLLLTALSKTHWGGGLTLF